jgi:hypothetical protein
VINIDTFHYKFGQGGCLRLVSQDQSGTRLSSSRAGDRGKPQNLAVDSLILPLPAMPPLKRTAGNSHGRRGRQRRGHPPLLRRLEAGVVAFSFWRPPRRRWRAGGSGARGHQIQRHPRQIWWLRGGGVRLCGGPFPPNSTTRASMADSRGV